MKHSSDHSTPGCDAEVPAHASWQGDLVAPRHGQYLVEGLHKRCISRAIAHRIEMTFGSSFYQNHAAPTLGHTRIPQAAQSSASSVCRPASRGGAGDVGGAPDLHGPLLWVLQPAELGAVGENHHAQTCRES